MTTGRGSEPVAQWSSCAPISTISALLLSRSTVARRTVQTLIGSYVALRTSTRPPDQRPQPSASGPCRWESIGGTDPSGAGGTAAVAIARGSVAQRFPEHRSLARDARVRAGSVERDGADLARQGEADGLGLLGGELELALAGVDLLAVRPGGLAVGDRGEHDAAVAGVEQRERGRLVARELAVGVVAHQGAVGDRAVESLLGRAHAPVEPVGHRFDALVQGPEGLLERARVRDEVVAAAAAEHDALVRAQPAQTEREHHGEHERDHRDTGGAQRDQPSGFGQLVHAGAVYERVPRRLALGEQRLVLGLVVVGLLLARHRRHLYGDADRGAERRRLLEGEVGGRARLRRDLVDRVAERDRVAAAALDADGDLDVELVVVAAVGELHRERRVGRV